jgi:hypothetical protein
MKTGQLYIALSDQLLSWAQDNDQLFLFKIGTTSDPQRRLRALNEGRTDEPGSGPCLNCTDWRWAERWHYHARALANEDEARLKEFLENRWRIFDRSPYPRFASARANGATEVYQIRKTELSEIDELVALSGARRNDLLDATVMSAIAHHIRLELEAMFPAVPAPEDIEEDEPYDEPWEPDDPDDSDDDDAKEDRDQESELQVSDLLSDQDAYGRSIDTGWYDEN